MATLTIDYKIVSNSLDRMKNRFIPLVFVTLIFIMEHQWAPII